jgi:hypothetical protein
MACASEEGAAGCRAASEAAWCHSGRREGVDGEARGATRRPSLALPLFVVALSSLVLPSTAQMGTIPQQYTNASRILSILGTTWSGAGYDNNGDAHYLFRPDDEMTGASRAACRPLCSIPCCLALLSLPPLPCKRWGIPCRSGCARMG